MAGSIILGWILVVLGILCIVVGIVIAALVSLDRMCNKLGVSLSSAIDKRQLGAIKIFLELLKEILPKPGGVFFVVGLLLLSGGIFLLIYVPF